MATLRRGGRLLLFGVIVLACTVGSMLLGWWDTAVPAALRTAIFAVLLFNVASDNIGREVVGLRHDYYDWESPRRHDPG